MKTTILPPSKSIFGAPPSHGIGEDAQLMAGRFNEVRQHFQGSFSLGSSQRNALEALYEVFGECCQPDWDGYGARKVSWENYLAAKRFVEALPVGFRPPEVSADPDGEISFEWYKDRNCLFSVSIGHDNELTYAGLFGASRTRGTELFFDEIPDLILNCIKRLER